MGIKVKIIPVKAYNSVGIVKRYYILIRRTYTIITEEVKDIIKEMAL